jgi:hypothetical protein
LLTICENWRGECRQFFCLLLNSTYQECFGTAYRFFIDSPLDSEIFSFSGIGVDHLDIREKLPDGAFDPTVQR